MMASSTDGGCLRCSGDMKRGGLAGPVRRWPKEEARCRSPALVGQSNADICALAAFRPTVSVVLSTSRSKGFQVSPMTFS